MLEIDGAGCCRADPGLVPEKVRFPFFKAFTGYGDGIKTRLRGPQSDADRKALVLFLRFFGFSLPKFFIKSDGTACFLAAFVIQY